MNRLVGFIQFLGLPLREVTDGLFDFIHQEQAQSETTSGLIAHGGCLHDFSILLANGMKHNYDWTTLTSIVYEFSSIIDIRDPVYIHCVKT